MRKQHPGGEGETGMVGREGGAEEARGKHPEPGVVRHTCNTSTWEIEAGARGRGSGNFNKAGDRRVVCL